MTPDEAHNSYYEDKPEGWHDQPSSTTLEFMEEMRAKNRELEEELGTEKKPIVISQLLVPIGLVCVLAMSLIGGVAWSTTLSNRVEQNEADVKDVKQQFANQQKDITELLRRSDVMSTKLDAIKEAIK